MSVQRPEQKKEFEKFQNKGREGGMKKIEN
jgi:hypothetical protein